MWTKIIKFTNKEEVFEKMDYLKELLEKKFKSSIKTNTQLIEFLVDEKIRELENL